MCNIFFSKWSPPHWLSLIVALITHCCTVAYNRSSPHSLLPPYALSLIVALSLTTGPPLTHITDCCSSLPNYPSLSLFDVTHCSPFAHYCSSLLTTTLPPHLLLLISTHHYPIAHLSLIITHCCWQVFVTHSQSLILSLTITLLTLTYYHLLLLIIASLIPRSLFLTTTHPPLSLLLISTHTYPTTHPLTHYPHCAHHRRSLAHYCSHYSSSFRHTCRRYCALLLVPHSLLLIVALIIRCYLTTQIPSFLN